jgi:hypothetical protein
MKPGQQCEVLVKYWDANVLEVWANDSLEQYIRQAPGVASCWKKYDTCYIVTIDCRFDKEVVEKAIRKVLNDR